MIKANVAYEMMEKALHLIPSHESTSTYLSAYGVFNLESGDCVAVRAANHGTFLYNWLKMQDKPFNVDLLTSANIAITFLDGSIPFSQNNNIEMDNGAEPPVFVVRQYVYNCAVLDANDINVIISASKKLIVDGVYTDPFEEDGTKHAIIYREKTNEPPKDVTAKTLKKHRAAKKKREQQLATDNNQKLNTEQYMNKKLIRLTEGDLHRIIKESVNKILNEIQFDGESLHGSNPEDWMKVSKARKNNALDILDGDEEYSANDERAPYLNKTYRASRRDEINAGRICVDKFVKLRPRVYRYNDLYASQADKVFNRGMGSLAFVNFLIDEKTILVNKVLANKRDIELIKNNFPEWKIEFVSLGYPDWYDTKNLKACRGK